MQAYDQTDYEPENSEPTEEEIRREGLAGLGLEAA